MSARRAWGACAAALACTVAAVDPAMPGSAAFAAGAAGAADLTAGKGGTAVAAAPAPAVPRPARVLPWRGSAPVPQGADTLSVQDILARRTALLDSLLEAETTVHDTTGLDSMVTALDRGGMAVARQITPRRAVKLSTAVRPLTLTTYDRVNGLRLGSGVGARAGRLAAIDADAAYALARERWAGAASFRCATRWKPLDMTAHWADRTAPFGPNQGAYFTSLAALVAGQDRQEYLHERAWDAGVALRPGRRITAGIRYQVRDEESAAVAAEFHFLGNDRRFGRPNPAVDARTTRAVVAQGAWSSRHDKLRVETEAGLAGGVLGGGFDGAWQTLRAHLAPGVHAGGRWILDSQWRNVTGSPPAQAASYLGGDGNLRGYEPLEFTGRRVFAVRAEYQTARDLLAQSGVPLLRRLHLQFIPFVDAGTVWGTTAAVSGSRALDGAWKSSVGLGIQRHLYYPGFGAVRVDVSRRTDGGPGGVDVWFRVLPLEP